MQPSPPNLRTMALNLREAENLVQIHAAAEPESALVAKSLAGQNEGRRWTMSSTAHAPQNTQPCSSPIVSSGGEEGIPSSAVLFSLGQHFSRQ